jgi:hypothetical protein
MKAIHCLIAGIILSAFVSNAGAADHQKGIKMLIDAASRHHRSQGSASDVGPDDKQRGINTLIEAATASRHPRPLSSPHAAKDTGSKGDGHRDDGGQGDGDDYMDRTLRDLRAGAVAARESAAPKTAPSHAPAATSGVNGASGSAVNAGADAARGSGTPKAAPGPGPAVTSDAATGAGGAHVSGVNAATPGATTRAVAVGLSNARRNRIASQDPSTVTGVPSLPSRGTLNATGMRRPTPAIGGAAISTNAGRLNGTAVRSKH